MTISLPQQKQQSKRRFRRTKQKIEYELAEIYKRLCNGESDLQIMTTLCLQERNYYKYKKRLEARIMEYQRKKTDNAIFMESQLFKNRMLTLYKALENQVTSNKTPGTDKAKCAEIASEIALDILRLEAESVKAIHDIGIGHNGNNVIKGQHYLENLRSKKSNVNNNNNNNNDYESTTNSDSEEECDPNRKF